MTAIPTSLEREAQMAKKQCEVAEAREGIANCLRHKSCDFTTDYRHQRCAEFNCLRFRALTQTLVDATDLTNADLLCLKRDVCPWPPG